MVEIGSQDGIVGGSLCLCYLAACMTAVSQQVTAKTCISFACADASQHAHSTDKDRAGHMEKAIHTQAYSHLWRTR
jgi:hypothetical protein